MRAVVHVKDAPDCRRHRFSDQSLCMWFDPDATGQRWTMADGLDQLAAHAARHLFQEASAAQVTRGPVRSRPARTRDRGPARRAEAKGLDPVMTALICGHSFGDVVRDFGPMLALVGLAGTLFVNGAREERRRCGHPCPRARRDRPVLRDAIPDPAPTPRRTQRFFFPVDRAVRRRPSGAWPAAILCAPTPCGCPEGLRGTRPRECERTLARQPRWPWDTEPIVGTSEVIAALGPRRASARDVRARNGEVDSAAPPPGAVIAQPASHVGRQMERDTVGN